LDENTVAAQYASSKYAGGLTPVETVTVTDPGGTPLLYSYDLTNNSRLISRTEGTTNPKVIRFGYDVGGFLDTVTDPNGNVVTTGHDVRGNTVSQTTCQNQAANACATTYYSYYPDDTSTTLTPD